MAIKEEWKNLIEENQSIYIYGAGNIGKKVLRLIKRTESAVKKVKGFLVSDLVGNPKMLDGFPVMIPENVSDRASLILVSVTDIYQETIVEYLKQLGFVNVIIAYKYSFMEEEVSDDFPKTIEINTNELMLCQYKIGMFNRYDIVVRLLAIEEYYEKNNYGFSLYEKMQSERAKDASYGKISLQRFIKLIESYEKNGYKKESELIIDEGLHLFDGSHRLALAIYFKIARLTVRIVKRETEVFYGKEWFEELFSQEKCNTIEEKLAIIETDWSGTVKGILWPSVATYFDEIVGVIEEQYAVTNINDMVFSADEFEQIVKEIYRMDSIAEWKINTKLKYMRPFSPYYVRLFDIDLGNPEFRMSKAAKGILSDRGAKLKEKIREMYKRRISGYFSDIIFHTADNFYQSARIEKLFYERHVLK